MPAPGANGQCRSSITSRSRWAALMCSRKTAHHRRRYRAHRFCQLSCRHPIAQSGEAGERAGTGSSVLSDMLGNRTATEGDAAQLATTSAPLDETYVVAQCVATSYRRRSSGVYAEFGVLHTGAMHLDDDGRCVRNSIPIGNGEHAAGYSDYNRASHFLLENTRLSECLDHNGMRLFVSEPFSSSCFCP